MEFLNDHFDARFAIKGSKPTYPPSRQFKTEHIRLDLNINIDREMVRGHCQTTFRAIVDATSRIELDGVNFQIRRVKWNGAKARFKYNKKKLIISGSGKTRANASVVVDIEYQINKPKLGMYFIKPNRFYKKRPTQVWTQGQDEFARYWFPCQDSPQERTTSEMVATVPAGFTAVSNGRLLKTTHNRSRRTSTFHWKQEIPHATYLVTLAIGKFRVLKDKWGKVPIHYYCEKGREKDVRRTFGKTPKMINFFSKAIGTQYPYPKYAQVVAHDFIYGGMENTSATTQTEYAVLDKRAAIDYTSDELVAHELAHQWFGDYLTCKDWTHAWLNESFATYFDALFKRHDLGQDEFLYAIRGNSEEYFEEDRSHYRRPIVTHIYKRPTDVFDRHLYEKGSVVLYMLHQWLGEDTFWKAIGHYVKENKTKVVETHDLINAFEQSTGQNMRQFFNQWIFGPGHPEYTLKWWWDNAKKQVNIRVVQSHQQGGGVGLFSVKTDFLIRSRSKTKRVPVEISKKTHLFKIELDRAPEMIVFDPGQKILKKVKFPRPEKMLINQVKWDENPLGRIDAIQSLARIDSAAGIKTIYTALLKDSFWGVQVQAARALGTIKRDSGCQLLIEALGKIKHPKVRQAIYGALKNFKSSHVLNIIEKKHKSEASYFAEMEGLRALGMGAHPKAKQILKNALKKSSWNDVIRCAALDGLAALKSDDVVPILLKHTQEGNHQRLRMVAIRNLVPFANGNEQIRKRLIELTKDTFLLVQISAVRALHQIGDERVVPTLKKLTSGDLDGRLMRLSEEAILHIMKGIE